MEENLQFSRKYNSEPYAAQTRWIAENAARYSIPFVIHLGDVVDQVRKPDQWKVADAAMRQLEAARIPYSILAGNHDVLSDLDYRDATSQATGTDAQRNLSAEPYLSWFPTARARAQSTFLARDPSGFHEAHVFEAQGVKFLVLSLSWRISKACRSRRLRSDFNWGHLTLSSCRLAIDAAARVSAGNMRSTASKAPGSKR